MFAEKDSPVYLAGAFDIVAAMIEGEPKVERCFRTGEGVRWGDTAGCLFCATGAFFRPGYVNNIVQNWLPALDGVVAKLKAGRQGRRRRLRRRLFDAADGARPFRTADSSVTTSTRLPLRKRRRHAAGARPG